ncbi:MULTISPECIES: TetR/AcrR family transcriptional regulator [Paenibacillus]|uniref:TetR/AcrR family transcriptional regulator n=1 Tax=Paenibacillus TaxID=44249 RepID=UPI0004724C64|nr:MULTISPECIES: TetR/AcrR family transcriptional regulator [Paenibacillus]KAF6627402.1 TetR/AcrR family transcriptional regulator [Paenibacillus sp. EKM208P]PNQ79187.1 TetR/AcrR family transcriptional regulator [Paenibacillus sp. F4]WCM60037.1 TetR/AcrR family transcriptional regulator [Paenibacillus polymyxa]
MAATDHAQIIKKDTKEWITIALLELLRTKRISELTISELVRKAGVSRMAFYRNYESLEQVLVEYYEPKFADIFNKIANKKNHEQKITDLTNFFLTFSDDFRLAIESDYTGLLYQIFKNHITQFYDELIPFPDWTGAKRNYWIHFMSAGVFEIWVMWIKNGQQETIEEISALIRLFHK